MTNKVIFAIIVLEYVALGIYFLIKKIRIPKYEDEESEHTLIIDPKHHITFLVSRKEYEAHERACDKIINELENK